MANIHSNFNKWRLGGRGSEEGSNYGPSPSHILCYAVLCDGYLQELERTHTPSENGRIEPRNPRRAPRPGIRGRGRESADLTGLPNCTRLRKEEPQYDQARCLCLRRQVVVRFDFRRSLVFFVAMISPGKTRSTNALDVDQQHRSPFPPPRSHDSTRAHVGFLIITIKGCAGHTVAGGPRELDTQLPPIFYPHTASQS